LKGARPLDNVEILLVAQQFDGTFATRNRALFMLGVSVGGRISELLALTIGDVWQNGKPVKDLLFQRRVVKGKQLSRMVPVNADGRTAIADLIAWHQAQYSDLDLDLNPNRPLFPSRKGCGDAAMTRKTGHIVLKEAFEKAGLNGKLATHSLRKSFAQRVYDASGDIYLTQELLGHASVETTQQYLGTSYNKAQRVVEAIETANRNSWRVLLHSPYQLHTDSLIVELQRRGYDATAIVAQMQPRQTGATDDAKVVPISQARRAHQVGAGDERQTRE